MNTIKVYNDGDSRYVMEGGRKVKLSVDPDITDDELFLILKRRAAAKKKKKQ